MKNNVKVFIFIIFVLAFLLVYIYCLPTYIERHILGSYNGWLPELSEKFYYSVVLNNKVLYTFFEKYVNNIDAWKIPLAIICNAVNMFIGYFNFKKKAWYYIVLCLTCFVTWMLIECYFLYTFETV